MRSRLFKQAVDLHLPQHLGLHLLATQVMAMQIKQYKDTPVVFYWIVWAKMGSCFLCLCVAQFSFQIHHVLGDAVTLPCIWCSTNWAGTQCCGKWEIRLLLESHSANLKFKLQQVRLALTYRSVLKAWLDLDGVKWIGNWDRKLEEVILSPRGIRKTRRIFFAFLGLFMHGCCLVRQSSESVAGLERQQTMQGQLFHKAATSRTVLCDWWAGTHVEAGIKSRCLICLKSKRIIQTMTSVKEVEIMSRNRHSAADK